MSLLTAFRLPRKICLANPNEDIEEKTRKIQEDNVQVLKRDDGASKNITLIDKKSYPQQQLHVMNEIQHLSGKGYNKFRLSKDAIILLEKISQDFGGEVLVLNTVTGTYFNANGENLNENGFGKEVAIWESAIDELEPIHIKMASKIMAKVRFPKYIKSSLS